MADGFALALQKGHALHNGLLYKVYKHNAVKQNITHAHVYTCSSGYKSNNKIKGTNTTITYQDKVECASNALSLCLRAISLGRVSRLVNPVDYLQNESTPK